MYDGCFGLNRRPFLAVPQVEHYFPARAIEDARTTLARCVQRGEGVALIIGGSGTGKTQLCLMMAEQFHRSFDVVMLTCGRLGTRRALFQAILYELGRPYRGMDEGELRLAIVDYLNGGSGHSRGILLLVDEAHTLPLRLLEEIRLLTNLVRNGQVLVRLVLAGGPVLEERFASPKLDSFSQRVVARCYLEAFNRTETRDYIQAQINAVGGNGGEVFPEDSCQSVFQATNGVPRLINQVCDHALLLAYVAGRKTIEPAQIEEAWADLQQLPAPWTGEQKSNSCESGVIEFGSLEDEENATCSTDGPSVFRVASMDDEVDSQEAEPGQQICRIERLLAEADDEFQPIGTIKPEIELYFDETPHPFQEAFEQEEVVSDRYSAVATSTPPSHAISAGSALLDHLKESVSEAPTVCVRQESVKPAMVAAESALEPVQRPAVNTTTSSRRNEYRQLFSQLRGR